MVKWILMSKIKIKQIRSRIGRPKDQKRTLDALGLRKMHQIVEHNLTPQNIHLCDTQNEFESFLNLILKD